MAQGVQFYVLAVAKSSTSSANGKISVQKGEFAIYQNVYLSLNMWRSLDVFITILEYKHVLWVVRWVVGFIREGVKKNVPFSSLLLLRGGEGVGGDVKNY